MIILSENLTIQHKLFAMDLKIKKDEDEDLMIHRELNGVA